MRLDRLVLWVALLTCGSVLWAAERTRLSAYERAQGWRLLFDGADASSWRGYRAEKLPANWQVREGGLSATAGALVVSAEEFADVELTFDWKVAAGGQGQVYLRVTEDGATGPEPGCPTMLLGGTGVKVGGNGVVEPDRTIVGQEDVWYRGKILIFGNLVEHWVNGDRVMSYVVEVGGAKGLPRHGRIALAGQGIEFRTIKVRSTGK